MRISANRVVALILFLGGFVVLMQPVLAQPGNWYAGIGAGLSRLAPDTDGSVYTLDDDVSAAGGVYLGRDVTQRLGVEAAWTQLGKATLSDGQDVEYSALSVGGIAYVLGNANVQVRQSGWAAYLRLGLSKISNESDILLAEQDNTAIWAGAGVQWPINPSWGVRGELASFDGDAQAAMASIYWRAGAIRSGVSSSRQPTRQAQPLEPAQPASRPQSERQPPIVMRDAPVPDRTAARPLPPTVVTVDPSLSDSASSCAVPAEGEPLDAQGCALFSGVLQGVEFEGLGTRLTPVAQVLLTRLAGSLNLYPELVVEIRVHTQSLPEPGRARKLSRDRAIAVARFLVGEGVDLKRLQARAFGDSLPRASNDTAGGRRLNNRIELGVL